MRRSSALTLAVSVAIATATAAVVSAAPARAQVRRVDLGTLGGASSTAAGVNSSGWVVGNSYTSSGQEHAFVWTPWFGMCDLGTLAGASSYATGINARGEVIGQSERAIGTPHAFRWRPFARASQWQRTSCGTMSDLGALPGTDVSAPAALDSRGDVVGMSVVGHSQHRAVLWPARGGLRTLYDVFGDSTSINTAGAVVGTALSDASSRPYGMPNGTPFAFVCDPSCRLIAAPAYGNAINDHGLVAGRLVSRDANGNFGPTRAVLWSPIGSRHRWRTRILAGLDSNAVALDGQGRVTGTWMTSTGQQRAFLWRSGRTTDLGTLGGSSTVPAAISSTGAVVGRSRTGSDASHAFCWTGRIRDLGTLGGTQSDAVAVSTVNRRLWVVGQAQTPSGDGHAVLWLP